MPYGGILWWTHLSLPSGCISYTALSQGKGMGVWIDFPLFLCLAVLPGPRPIACCLKLLGLPFSFLLSQLFFIYYIKTCCTLFHIVLQMRLYVLEYLRSLEPQLSSTSFWYPNIWPGQRFVSPTPRRRKVCRQSSFFSFQQDKVIYNT